jgi:hypothetical protein
MPKEGYETAYCSHDASVQMYRNPLGWYVCYAITYHDHEQTLTFGPMQDEQSANSLKTVLRDTYCEIREQYEPDEDERSSEDETPD